MTCLFVPGTPRPQGSKRHVGGGRMIEASQHVAGWRTTITGYARLTPTKHDTTGPVHVYLNFVMPRPKSEPTTTRPHTRRPDIDKLSRAALDALDAAGWFGDDAQVVALHATKHTANPDETEGVHISVHNPGKVTD